ncbi:diaminopimelate epimerase [Candidatus Skiveiella danica]|jgi:diaminopimelate epimerase|uniref:diaminopimelate epimerase n=1 Tax=Candidatus Skiveiella danica TaxID=3386177 RepID=UPI001B57DEF9|nr:diaminopimelate epimerase [Burkholderiaceae bacterium]
MKIRFTKMQGAGNDFVVLDETRSRLNLSAGQYRFLADRHFGVGADQILTVRPAPEGVAGQGLDFEYVIHNADGGEVEHCGNGARCFVRYVREKGLTAKDAVKVKVVGGVLELRQNPDGRVTVDMGAPVFDLPRIPFDPADLSALEQGTWQVWPLKIEEKLAQPSVGRPQDASVSVAVLSMGNPHAVQVVDDVDTAPVQTLGARIESHPAFPRRVNAGFMQIMNRSRIRLRVFERGAGETLACGTGACAAVVAGIRLGLLDARVDVETRGGQLTIEWAGAAGNLAAPVLMTGPAATVFEGEIDIPELT